jgi:hypothetical protein
MGYRFDALAIRQVQRNAFGNGNETPVYRGIVMGRLQPMESKLGRICRRFAQENGVASPIAKTLGGSGRPFVQLVIEALDANRITSVQASRYLDLRFDHFDNLRAELRIGHRRRTGARDEGD